MTFIPNAKFKQWRKSKKLSQIQLAEQLKVSQGTITDIERGRIGVSKRVADKLFELYGVKREEIQGDLANSDVINNENNNEKIQGKNTGVDTGGKARGDFYPEEYFNDKNFYLKTHFEKKLFLDMQNNFPEINELEKNLHTLQTFEFMINNFNFHYFNKYSRQFHSAENYYSNGKFNYEKYRDDYFKKLKELEVVKPALSKIANAIMQFYKEFEQFDSEEIMKGYFGIPASK